MLFVRHSDQCRFRERCEFQNRVGVGPHHSDGERREGQAENRSKPTRAFSEIVVGDPEIATVSPLTDQSFYVLGKSVGTTGIALVRSEPDFGRHDRRGSHLRHQEFEYETAQTAPQIEHQGHDGQRANRS